MHHTFAYLRLSPVPQLAEEERALISAAGHAVEAQRVFEETISGSCQVSQRPVFQRVLSLLEAGDRLIVTELNSIGRDAIDVCQTIATLKSKRVKLTVLQLGQMDVTSPSGEQILRTLMAVADCERELIVERTKMGRVRAKAEGTHMGRPSKISQERRQLILRRLAAGEQVASLAEEFQISRSTINRIAVPLRRRNGIS